MHQAQWVSEFVEHWLVGRVAFTTPTLSCSDEKAREEHAKPHHPAVEKSSGWVDSE